MTKYYVTLNKYNEIIRPYSDEDGFVPPADAIEITKDQLDIYISIKKEGIIVSLIDGGLVYYDKKLSPLNIKKNKIKEIVGLLDQTDKTQLLDNRLSSVKQQEFATYREELRVILRELNNGGNPVDFTLPSMPTYE